MKDEELDVSDCVQKILEGLRGDVFCIARDVGLDRLLRYDGIDYLVEEIWKQAFPSQSEEASELFRHGQLITGPRAKLPAMPSQASSKVEMALSTKGQALSSNGSVSRFGRRMPTPSAIGAARYPSPPRSG